MLATTRLPKGTWVITAKGYFETTNLWTITCDLMTGPTIWDRAQARLGVNGGASAELKVPFALQQVVTVAPRAKVRLVCFSNSPSPNAAVVDTKIVAVRVGQAHLGP